MLYQFPRKLFNRYTGTTFVYSINFKLTHSEILTRIHTRFNILWKYFLFNWQHSGLFLWISIFLKKYFGSSFLVHWAHALQWAQYYLLVCCGYKNGIVTHFGRWRPFVTRLGQYQKDCPMHKLPTEPVWRDPRMTVVNCTHIVAYESFRDFSHNQCGSMVYRLLHAKPLQNTVMTPCQLV